MASFRAGVSGVGLPLSKCCRGGGGSESASIHGHQSSVIIGDCSLGAGDAESPRPLLASPDGESLDGRRLAQPPPLTVQQLDDIQEEEDNCHDNGTIEDGGSSSSSIHYKRSSPSTSSVATPSSKALKKKSRRDGRMQAEQGTLGELQKYHNRYLKNRRHTLANVR